MKIIDISIPLDNETVIYPGNVPLSISIHHSMPEHATHLSSITFGSHTGTHIDAPSHAVAHGKSLDQIPLVNFVGPCRVLDFSNESGEAVTLEFLKSKNIKEGERILLKTKNSLTGFKEFYDDYVYLDGEGAEYLASINILVVGIDSLSIKKRGGSDVRPHTALLEKNIPIIEGLDLSEVSEMSYELYCLPLNFQGIEGSPARAILIEK